MRKHLLSPVMSLGMSLCLGLGILVADLTNVHTLTSAGAQSNGHSAQPVATGTLVGEAITATNVLVNGARVSGVFRGSVGLVDSIVDSRIRGGGNPGGGGSLDANGIFPGDSFTTNVTGIFPGDSFTTNVTGIFPGDSFTTNVTGIFPGDSFTTNVTGIFPGDSFTTNVTGIFPGDSLQVTDGVVEGDNVQVIGGVITGENLRVVGAVVSGRSRAAGRR